jgi:hypothetical protein
MKKTPQHSVRSFGISLIEVVIGSAILLTVIISLVFVSVQALQMNRLSLDRAQAQLFAETGFELVRFMRDTSFTTLEDMNIGEEYDIVWNGSSFEIISGPSLFGKFSRAITLHPVYRDGNSNIASSGTEDTQGRRIVVSVSWQGGNMVETQEGYVFDIFRD